MLTLVPGEAAEAVPAKAASAHAAAATAMRRTILGERVGKDFLSLLDAAASDDAGAGATGRISKYMGDYRTRGRLPA